MVNVNGSLFYFSALSLRLHILAGNKENPIIFKYQNYFINMISINKCAVMIPKSFKTEYDEQ